MATDKIAYKVQGIIALANGSRELDAAKATAFGPADMQASGGEVDIVPAQHDHL
jgi:hypothetical protein